MYMESIVAAKAPVTSAQRRAVGSLLVVLSVLVMVPWRIAIATWTVAILGLRALIALPRFLSQAIDHAGTSALGR